MGNEQGRLPDGGQRTAYCGQRTTPVRRPLSAERPFVFRRDRRAIGGFFEEIPAFVVVVLSVSLFLVAAYTTLGRLGQDRELSSLQDECQRLCRAFRGYEAVLEKGQISMEPESGVFEAGKLDALDYSTLQGALNSPHLYNLTVRDLLTGQNWSFGCGLPAGAAMKVEVSSAAVVANGNGGHDPARIGVVMWE
jgi:hypothetical protein